MRDSLEIVVVKIKDKPESLINQSASGQLMVHLTGIEPAHLSILDPKSSASASSATGATAAL